MRNTTNRHSRRSAPKGRQALRSAIEALENRIVMDATYASIASGPLSQNWNNTALISTSDDWSGVPSIIGYQNAGGASSGGANPQNILAFGNGVVDVNANQTNPATFNTGGVTEFEIANPSIGLIGSNSSGSPFILLHVNTVGVSSVDVSYNVRDLEASADNAVMPIALQYRIGASGDFTNVPSAFVADATTVGTDTQVTAVGVTLPAEAANQPQLQIRIITANAPGNDEAVGIDDILVRSTPVQAGQLQLNPASYRVNEGGLTASLTVTRTNGSSGVVSATYTTSDGTGIAGQDYASTVGTVTFANGETSKQITVNLVDDTQDEGVKTFNVTLSSPTGGATLGAATSATVTILDNDGAEIASGPFTQDWSDTNQISVSDNWEGVPNILGYLRDADRDNGVVDVNANQTNPATFNTGGVTEFELTDPTIALAGSGTATAPQLVIDINTLGVPAAEVSFNARDLDDSTDDAVQPITVYYRIGDTGDFIEMLAVPDVTVAGATQSTPFSVLLPPEALGQQLVQIRIATADAGGNDEPVGIDDIYIGAPQATPGTLAFSSTVARVNEAAGTATITVSRNGGSAGSVSVDYTTADIVALAGSDYTATSGTLTFGDGVTTQDIVVPISQDLADELGEAFSITLSNATGGALLGTTSVINVTIADDDGHVLSAGPLLQDWSDTELVTTNDNWNNVPNIVGYGSDADRDAGIVDVLANQSNPNISNGGVVEFAGLEDPTVGFQGSNAAAQPQLVLDLNTTSVSGGTLSFNARDLDGNLEDAVQPVTVSYRIGATGEFIELFNLEDATTGPSEATLVTPVSLLLPAEALGQQLVQIRIATSNVAGTDEFVGIDDIAVTATPVSVATVVGRQIFYNRSAFDGNNAAATVADDAALATDKTALLPGGTATFANYTSYSRGINGIFIDVSGATNPAGLTASDFTFRVGNVNDTTSWTTAPAPLSIDVREGAGVGGSDRVTIIWADNAIQKQWLQVTTLATANTGLATADVFYFGNAIGDSGNTTANAAVNSADELGARNNPRNPLVNPAAIDFAFDYNRDRSVNSADQLIARNNGTNPLTNALRLIAPTAPMLLATAPQPVTTSTSTSTFMNGWAVQSLFSDREILA